MTKRRKLLLSYIAVLAVLYACSFGIFISYKAVEISEIKKARELPSTDLSGFNEKLGTSNYIDIHPRLDYHYNGELIDAANLKSFFGDNYIEITYRRLVYIDHENNLRLILSMDKYRTDENIYATLSEFNADSYKDYLPVDMDYYGVIEYIEYGYVWGSFTVMGKFEYDYSIFDKYNDGFTAVDFWFLPFYYSVLPLPALVLMVYRNKKAILLNVLWAIVNIAWIWIPVWFYITLD